MEFRSVLAKRRMVRRYADTSVDDDLVHAVLAAGTRAPSAGFSQGWDFLVLTSQADRDLFWQKTTDAARAPDAWLSGMRTAPVLIVCLSHEEAYRARYSAPDKPTVASGRQRWLVPYWHIDTGMAALLMLLAAVDAGLGGCFFGVPPEHLDDFRDAFDVPESRVPVGVVSLGHPADEGTSRPLRGRRRSLAEVTHTGRFGVPLAAPRTE